MNTRIKIILFVAKFESRMYLNSLVNRRKIRHWSENNLHVTIEIVMKSPKLRISCAMSKHHFSSKARLLMKKIIYQSFNLLYFNKMEL